MNIEYVLMAIAAFFSASFFLTYFIFIFFERRGFYDIPNARSSHAIPTPKGGGIVIAVSIVLCLLWLSPLDYFKYEKVFIFLITIVACVAFADDIVSLSVKVRAVVYLICAFLFTLLDQNISLYTIEGIVISVIVTVVIAWCLNLYNFMDGADGVASIQAIFSSFIMGILFVLDDEWKMGLLFLCVAASVLGFLLWNWAPAKIFMGDVGSCTLGFFFACMAYISYSYGIISIYLWAILFSVFIVDASLTLFMRIILKENFLQAHKSHGYQRFLLLGNSHKMLSIWFCFVQLFFICPLAVMSYYYPKHNLQILIIVYTLLSLIWSLIQYKYSKKELG